MAFRTRLSIGDILHRGVVWSLFGITVWGAVMIGVVHRNTLAAGRGAQQSSYIGDPSLTVIDTSRRGIDTVIAQGYTALTTRW